MALESHLSLHLDPESHLRLHLEDHFTSQDSYLGEAIRTLLEP